MWLFGGAQGSNGCCVLGLKRWGNKRFIGQKTCRWVCSLSSDLLWLVDPVSAVTRSYQQAAVHDPPVTNPVNKHFGLRLILLSYIQSCSSRFGVSIRMAENQTKQHWCEAFLVISASQHSPVHNVAGHSGSGPRPHPMQTQTQNWFHFKDFRGMQRRHKWRDLEQENKDRVINHDQSKWDIYSSFVQNPFLTSATDH